MHIAPKNLRELLLNSGFVSSDEMDFAEAEATRSGHEVFDVLIGRGVISEEIFAETLQPYFGVPVVNLKRVIIDNAVLNMIPEQIAKSRKVILYGVDGEGPSRVAHLAMIDPFDYGARSYVSALLGMWVEPAFMTQTSFRHGLKQYEPDFGSDFSGSIERHAKEAIKEEVEKGLGGISLHEGGASVSAILDRVLDHAITRGATDVHFEPLGGGMLVRFRIDGVMREIIELPSELVAPLVARVKVLAHLAVDEHRAPQDGRFRFESEDGAASDIRVNIIPVFHGEKAEMRLLRGAARPLSLTELGFSQEAIAIVESESKRPHGMILSTGPTGHGKTTTLYAILHLLNTPDVNITTIEDPIEYEFPRVNQTQVNVKAGVTFATGLRALMRQNPDIIMVGEIRDNETVEVSIQAALTGHRVLSTLHTNDATSAPSRLVDMGAEPFLLSSTINLIVAQRLVRRICTSCVVSEPADKTSIDVIKQEMKLRNEEHITHLPTSLFHGKGCEVCNYSGYLGQVGIYEVFPVSEKIRTSISKNAPAQELRKMAIKEGMVTMFEDGLRKVELGTTTIEEVIRVARE